MSDKLLTIGMAVYDDYDGVYFTLQSLRMYHKICNTDQIEFIVIDNNPNGKHSPVISKLMKTVNGKYIPYTEKASSFNKYKVVEQSTGKYVIIMDCHVLLVENAIDILLDYYNNHPNCKDLIQGPLLYNDLKTISTHFDQVFRGHMYGIWATNKEAYNKGEPFEIPMQGMGFLSFERANWPGINNNFIGFGAEEWYIAEKFRQNGGKNICIPQLKWVHRFDGPEGVKYPLCLEDRVWNYFVGWYELYKDYNHQMIKDAYNHFKNELPAGRIDLILNKAKEGLNNWR